MGNLNRIIFLEFLSETFQLVNRAYQVLRDVEKRSIYDKFGSCRLAKLEEMESAIATRTRGRNQCL